MAEAKTPMAYIRDAMRELGAFIPDWKALNKKDKEELVEYAKTEMDVLGIPIKVPTLQK